MKAIIFLGLMFALAGCDNDVNKALEEKLSKTNERLAKAEEKIANLEAQGKPNWILEKAVKAKENLSVARFSAISAFNSKELCLKAAVSMVDADAVQTSLDSPEFESPTKIFIFRCLPSTMQPNTK
jgi:hypothetical protein